MSLFDGVLALSRGEDSRAFPFRHPDAPELRASEGAEEEPAFRSVPVVRLYRWSSVMVIFCDRAIDRLPVPRAGHPLRNPAARRCPSCAEAMGALYGEVGGMSVTCVPIECDIVTERIYRLFSSIQLRERDARPCLSKSLRMRLTTSLEVPRSFAICWWVLRSLPSSDLLTR